jgi:glycosyltransferase involved in cell wall biosynthesis
MKLSICYPVYDDFNGLYFSAMDIPLSHPEICDDIEIVVLDNNPSSVQGKRTNEWVNSQLKASVSAKYIPFEENFGSALAKQKCIDNSLGEFFLIMDSHVRVARGGIAKLLDYYKEHPKTSDLFSGPMFYDSEFLRAGRNEVLRGYSTHLDEVWRGESLGIWATNPQGEDINNEPFEIPAMGCGLFSCRKEAFVGFNPKFKGFGAEEYYIHHKTRMAGNKCICLPFLRWVHRFDRPTGVPYPITRLDKVRNYIIGHLELDMPLEGIYDHFIKTGLVSENDWNKLLEEQNYVTKPENIASSIVQSVVEQGSIIQRMLDQTARQNQKPKIKFKTYKTAPKQKQIALL